MSFAIRCELQVVKSGVLDIFLENISLHHPDLSPICFADNLDVYLYGLHHGSIGAVCY